MRAGAAAGVAEVAGVGRLAAGSRVATIGRSAGALAMTEASLAAVARGSGLPAVLEELSVARPMLNASGHIIVNGRTVLLASESGFIRIPSTREVIGRFRNGQIFAPDSHGVFRTQIGDLRSPAQRIVGETPMEVTWVREGWYRVTVADQSAGLPFVPLVSGKVLYESD